jgi:hypothetical protein
MTVQETTTSTGLNNIKTTSKSPTMLQKQSELKI